MRIESIKLNNFRNYQVVDLKIKQPVNIFYGNNAQGKTNILESIYYAAFGFSFRTKNEEELKNFTAQDFSALIEFSNKYGKNTLKMLKTSKKEIFYNENKIRAKEQYGLLNVVLFAPDDLQLIKGEPSLRRRFLNMEIAQTNSYYYNLLVKYNKILVQRNKFLKLSSENVISEQEFAVWDEQLAMVAAEILPLRQEVLHKLAVLAGSIYQEIPGQKENLTLHYSIKINNEFKQDIYFATAQQWQDFYLEELKKRRSLDLVRKYTSVGPHRDDLTILVNDKNLKAFGSQGQQRSGALALKLAELEYIKEAKGEYPILLLDDVMSELDQTRRQHILHFINDKVQTFITVNDKELVNYLPASQYYQVLEGKIIEA